MTPLAVLGHHELDIRIALHPLERLEIDLRQRVLDPFPPPAERIVRQHGDNGSQIVTAGVTDGDLGNCCHDLFRWIQRADGSPSAFSVSPIQRRTAA